jgi:hypothetical protein
MTNFKREQIKEGLNRITELQKRFDLKIDLFYNLQIYKYCPEYGDEIENFEEKYNAFVYYCLPMYSKLTKSNQLCMLYVSSQKEEWENERIFNDNYIYSYVYDVDNNYGEFGGIVLDTMEERKLIRIG